MKMRLELPLTAKQLVAQRSNIVRKQLLSELEIEEIKQQVDSLLPTIEEPQSPEIQLETNQSYSTASDPVYINPETLDERVSAWE